MKKIIISVNFIVGFHLLVVPFFQGVLDLILVAFDICSLLYVYASRMYIVYKFMSNLNSMFPDATDKDSRFGITMRIFYIVLVNALLFGFMIMHLSLQIYHENLPENKPYEHRQKEAALGEGVEVMYMSYVTGMMILMTVIIPIYNIVVYILANYYYILELMIKINVHVIQKEDCRRQLEEHGDVAKGIMGFAGKNVHATPGRLRDIQTLSTFQRVFYVLREWWIDLIFLVWASLLVGYSILFYDYYSNHVALHSYADSTSSQQTFSIVYICSFMLCAALFLMGNYHSFVVVFITIVISIPLFFSFTIQAIIDKYREAAGKTIHSDKDKFAGIVTIIAKKKEGDAPPPLSRPPSVACAPEEYIPEDATDRDTLCDPVTSPLNSRSSYMRPITRSQSPVFSTAGLERAKTVNSVVISMASVEIPDNSWDGTQG